MGYSPQGHKESDTTEVTNPGEGMEKREPLYTVDGNVNWCSHYENSMENKIKNKITISSRNLTPGHISSQKYNSKSYIKACVHCSTVHNSQDMETT